MAQALHIFEQRKEAVINQLKKLDKIAEDMNLSYASKQLTDSIFTLYREQFEIMVVGEFSNGKSTFVNALLQKEILPSSVKPTTAILNKIYYAMQPKYELYYKNAKPKEINEETFKKIVAPRNPGNDERALLNMRQTIELIKKIDHAEIGYPLALCENNIVIIDSPGTNDLDPTREAITNHYIPKSDAAIIVFNATRALSESEMSFLRDRILAADIHKIFFVINFKDHLRKKEDEEKVVHYVIEELSTIVKDPKIFLLSSRHALLNYQKRDGKEIPKQRRPLLPLEQTGFPEFEAALIDFLQFDRGAVKLEKPMKTGIRIANELIEKHIPFERISINNNITDLNEKTKRLTEELNTTRRIGKESAKKIKMKLIGEGFTLKNWYESELRQIANTAHSTLSSRYYQGCDESSVRQAIETRTAPLEKKLHEDFKQKIEEKISNVITIESKELEQAFSSFDSRFTSMVSDQTRTPDVVTNMFMRHSGKITGVFIASTILSGFWLAPGAILLGGLIVIGGFIWDGVNAIASFFTGKDHILEKLKKNVNERFVEPIPQKVTQFEREWSNVVSKVIAQYEEIVNQQIQEKENQLHTLIKNNQLSEDEMKELLNKLNEREKVVRDIIIRLEQSNLKMEVGV